MSRSTRWLRTPGLSLGRQWPRSIGVNHPVRAIVPEPSLPEWRFGRPLDQFVTTTPLEEGPDHGDGYDYSNRPVPRPPLDFKPLKPPTRGPLAVAAATPAVGVPTAEVPFVPDAAESAPANPHSDQHGITEPSVAVPAVATAPEEAAVTIEHVASGEPPIDDGADQPEESNAPVDSPAPVAVPAGPGPQPVYEIPPALIYRMRNLEFLPMKPPLRGPFAPNWDPSALIGAVPSMAVVAVAPPVEEPPSAPVRAVPPPPPGFKPLKPPIRGTPLAAAAPEEPALVSNPTDGPVTEEARESVDVPRQTPPAESSRPMSLAELAALASCPPAAVTRESPPTPTHSEIVVDW